MYRKNMKTQGCNMKTSVLRQKSYQFAGMDLSSIRNRNERRVIAFLPEIFKEYPDFEQSIINVQDVYALALNQLPARYTQSFSIVLDDHVDEGRIKDAIRYAIKKVRDNPTGPEKRYEPR
jgi:hypothetical protein